MVIRIAGQPGELRVPAVEFTVGQSVALAAVPARNGEILPVPDIERPVRRGQLEAPQCIQRHSSAGRRRDGFRAVEGPQREFRRPDRELGEGFSGPFAFPCRPFGRVETGKLVRQDECVDREELRDGSFRLRPGVNVGIREVADSEFSGCGPGGGRGDGRCPFPFDGSVERKVKFPGNEIESRGDRCGDSLFQRGGVKRDFVPVPAGGECECEFFAAFGQFAAQAGRVGIQNAVRSAVVGAVPFRREPAGERYGRASEPRNPLQHEAAAPVIAVADDFDAAAGWENQFRGREGARPRRCGFAFERIVDERFAPDFAGCGFHRFPDLFRGQALVEELQLVDCAFELVSGPEVHAAEPENGLERAGFGDILVFRAGGFIAVDEDPVLAVPAAESEVNPFAGSEAEAGERNAAVTVFRVEVVQDEFAPVVESGEDVAALPAEVGAEEVTFRFPAAVVRIPGLIGPDPHGDRPFIPAENTAEVVLQVAGGILAAEVKRFPVFSFDEGELSGLPEPGAVEGELRLRGTVERGVEFEVVFLRAAGNNGAECEQDTDESGFHGNHRRVSNSCGKRPGRSQARSTGPSG